MVTKAIYVWPHLRKRLIQFILQIIKEYVQISHQTAHLGYPLASCGFEAKYHQVGKRSQVSSGSAQAWDAPHFHAAIKSNLIYVFISQWHLTDLTACAGAFWCFLFAAGVLGPGLSLSLLRRSLSLCRRMVCRVVRYSREKLLRVLQKSSALISFTIALE